MKIDIEKIRKYNNLSVLEYYLENLTFSNISENEISSVPKKYIVKLIKIYQFIIEILLNCQNYLENNLQILQDENYKLINENENKDTIIRKNRSIISNLKKEKENDLRILLTYKNIINNSKKKNNQDLPLNIIVKEDKNKKQLQKENIEDEIIYCQYCKNVKFNSKIELQNHLRKAHKINENEAKKNFEKKLYELTNQFEDYVKTCQGSTFNFMETQSKIENEKYEKEIGKIENKFKNTLSDLKDLYITNYLNNEKQNKYKLDDKIIIEKKNDDENIIFLKNQLYKMNLTLEKMNKNNQNSINDLRKSFNEKFKKIIFEKENNKIINNHNKSISFDFNDDYLFKDNILNEKDYDNQLMMNKDNNNQKFKNKLENKNILNEKVIIEKNNKIINNEIWNNEIIKKNNLNINEKIDDLENNNEIHLQSKKINLKSIEEKEENKKKVKNEFKQEVNKEEIKKENKEDKKENNEIKKEEKIENKEKKNEENKNEKIDENKEENKDEDIKENQQENNILKTKNKRINKYDSLNEFYIAYKKRDQNTFKEPIEENYIETILPDNFNKDDNYIQNTIKESFLNITNQYNKNNIHINFENIEFENEETKNIISLIDTTLKNIEKLNSKNKILNKYYESIFKFINFDLFEEKRKKIVNSENPHRRDYGILNENHDDIISDINRINLSQIKNINDEFEIDLSKKEENEEDEFGFEEEEKEEEKEKEKEVNI